MKQEQIKSDKLYMVFDADKENSKTTKYFEKLAGNCFIRKKRIRKMFIVMNGEV